MIYWPLNLHFLVDGLAPLANLPAAAYYDDKDHQSSGHTGDQGLQGEPGENNLWNCASKLMLYWLSTKFSETHNREIVYFYSVFFVENFVDIFNFAVYPWSSSDGGVVFIVSEDMVKYFLVSPMLHNRFTLTDNDHQDKGHEFSMRLQPDNIVFCGWWLFKFCEISKC